MNIEYFLYWILQFLFTVIFFAVAIYLVYSSKEVSGKGWLLASVITGLIVLPGGFLVTFFTSLATFMSLADSAMSVYQWNSVLSMSGVFGTACFGFYLLAVWSRSRVRLNISNVLFSFSGRIPRSIFWLALCILLPLTLYINFNPFASAGMEITRLFHRVIYLGWIPVGLWIVIALCAKRWHDVSRSGWLSLILLVPVLGAVVAVLYLGFAKGTKGPNRYGDDPVIAGN